MLAADLQFTDGEVKMPLRDGKVLSVCNVDREPYLRRRLARDPMAMVMSMFTDPHEEEEVVRIKADEHSWEVALMDPDGDYGSMEVPEFADYYSAETSNANWAIYGNVPIPVVLAWLEERR